MSHGVSLATGGGQLGAITYVLVSLWLRVYCVFRVAHTLAGLHVELFRTF